MPKRATKYRLKEMLRAVPIAGKSYPDYIEALADRLVSEGVIIPPCKVGDTVYYIDAFDFEPCKKSGQGGGVCPHLYAEYGFGYECLKGKLGAKPCDCTEIKSKRIGTLEKLISYWDCFVAKMVELLPASDVEEVRRGKWQYAINARRRYAPVSCDMLCSACGAAVERLDGVNYRFCPECGAKMDGERSENGN